jgi:probable HAF family extracellular repeat protein
VGRYTVGTTEAGFLLTGGSFSSITFPGADYTEASGINTAGQIVGTYSRDEKPHGFLLDDGKFSTIDFPGAAYTAAHGVNDTAQVVGYYNDGVKFHGFLLSGGHYSTIDFPGSRATVARGINAAGQIVGSYFDGTTWHGYSLSQGGFSSISFPEADFTEALGINAAGQIVGSYSSSSPKCGYLFSEGRFSEITFPSAESTEAQGINAAGQIVGSHSDEVTSNGFLGIPIFRSITDFNSDGKPDLIWQNQASGLTGVWFMDGVTQSGWSYFNPVQAPDTTWKIVGSEDFNADGKRDIVWQNQASGHIGVWFMDGVTQSGWSYFNPVQAPDTSWKIAAIGDFNSDGKPDLIWQSEVTSQIAVWFLDGVNLASPSYFNPGQAPDADWKIMGVSDFNGDGQADLVWQNQATGHIGVWFMHGVTQSGWSYLDPSQVLDTNWKIVGMDYFNFDSKPDLIWQNQATGQIGVWFMDGTVLSNLSYFHPGQVSDTNWRVAQVWNQVTVLNLLTP